MSDFQADLHEIKSPTDMSIGVKPELKAPSLPAQSTPVETPDQPASLAGTLEKIVPEPIPETDTFGRTEKPSLAGTLDNAFGLNYEAEAVRSVAMSSKDPEAVYSMYDEALALQPEFRDMSVFQIMANLPEMKAIYFGDNAAVKTDAKAIWDATHAGAKMVELGMAGSDAMIAAWSGNSAEGDKRVKEIQKEIAELSLDVVPRSWWVEGLKILGNMTPYTLYFMGTTAAATALGGAVGGEMAAAGLTKTALATMQAIKGLNMLQSAKVMAGIDYADMTANGIDPKIASNIAPFTGVVNSLVEQYVGAGLEGGIQRAFGREIVEGQAKKIASRIMASGATKTIGAQLAEFHLKNMLGEATEEAFQSAVTGVGKIMAESLMEDSSKIGEKTDIGSVSREMAESFVTSLWTSAILGIPATSAMYFNSRDDAAEVKRTAMFSTEEQFKRDAKDMKQFANVPESQKEEVASTIWKAAQEEVSVAAEEMKANAREKQTEDQKEPVRMPNGALDIQEEVVGEAGEATRVTFTAADPLEGSAYADVTVSLGDDTITIDDANFTKGYEGLADEMLQEVAARYPSKKVVLGDTGSQVDLVAGAYDRIAGGDASGKEVALASDTPAQAQEVSRLRTEFAGKAALSPLGVEMSIQWARFIYGKDFERKTKNLTIVEDKALATDGKAGALSPLTEIANEVQYVMKLAENANASTVVHEIIHHARKTSNKKAELKAIEDLYGIADGKWETVHEERFTNDIMQLITENKVSDERARPFLEHIATFLKRLWRGPLSKVQMDEKVSAALNDWLSADETFATEEIVSPLVAEKEATVPDDATAREVQPEVGVSLDKDEGEDSPLIPDVNPGKTPEMVRMKGTKIMRNYKENSDPETGVTQEGLDNMGTYDPEDPEPIIVFREKSGEDWVASGRHRFKKRLDAGYTDILAYVYREADGYTEKQMQIKDVWSNVKQGTGTVRDFVFLAKEGVIDYGSLEARGLMGKSKARQGVLIGQYASNGVYSAFMAPGNKDGSIISAEKAAVIADYGRGDEGVQQFGLTQQKGMKVEELAQLLMWYKDSQSGGGQLSFDEAFSGGGDLFGESFDAQIERQKKAIRGASDLVADLQEEITVRRKALSQSEERVQDKLKGESKTTVEDKVLMRQKISLLEDDRQRIKNGEWRHDPQLAAMVHEKAGLPLTQLMIDAKATARQALDVVETNSEPTLFMSQDELKQTAPGRQERLMLGADKFADFDKWIESYFPYKQNLTKEDLDWLRGVFDFAHSPGARKYKKGEFSKSLKSGADINSFLFDIADAIQPKRQGPRSQYETIRADRLRKAISGAPVLSRAINRIRAGRSLTSADYMDIKRFIADNEALVKFIKARLTGDTNLAYEAAMDMKRVPLLSKKTVLVKPGMSFSDQQNMIDSFTKTSIKESVRDGSITIGALNEYKNMFMSRKDQSVRERDAIRRLSAEIAKMRRFIMRPTSSSLSPRYARIVSFIHEYLSSPARDPAGMAATMRSLGSIVFQGEEGLLESIIGTLDSISKRPFAEWTFDELSALVDFIDLLNIAGKAAKVAERLAFTMMVERDQMAVLSVIDAPDDVEKGGTVQADEQQRSHAMKTIFDVPNMRTDLVASFFLDKKRRGVNTRILFDEMIKHQRDKLERIQDRTSIVTDMLKTFSAKDDMHNELVVEGVAGVDGLGKKYTAANLLGAYLMVGNKEGYNQHQREAFVFGNLFSQDEKTLLGNEKLMGLLEDRANKIIDAAETLLTPKQLELGRVMMEKLNAYSDWERMAKEIFDFSGKEMSREKFYFPIKMDGKVTKEDDPILGAFQTVFDKALEDGFVYDRSANISPINRREIDINSIRIFYDSIKHQEHLVAYGAYVKKLKSVYGDSNPRGRVIRERIRSMYGDGVLKAIDKQIDTLCQPGDFGEKDISEKPFALFRGSVVVASLSYRFSSVLMQLGTSPLPFLSEVNAFDLARVAGKAINGVNPMTWFEDIESKSAILKDRQLESIIELNRMNDSGLQGSVKRIGQFGMKGLEFADRFSVAIGWQAIVEKKMGEHMSEAEARDYADKFIIRTQPSSDPLYRAPMYRDMNLFKRMLLQFTQPMNVIYQNLRYDSQIMANEGEWMKVFAMIGAYVMSGVAIGATAAIRGRGPEDEDKLLEYWTTYSMSQFTGSVPLVGDPLNQFILAWALGENYRPFGDDNLPVVSDMFSGANELMKAINADSNQAEIMAKAALFMYRGLGSVFGAPVLATENAAKLALKLAGMNEE